MDSLTAVEFRNHLMRELPGLKLASTLMSPGRPRGDEAAGISLVCHH